LASLTSHIAANSRSGATSYGFEITYNNQAYFLTSTDRWFYLTEVTNLPLVYAASYSVRARIENGTGNWGAYGTACTITTPAIATTELAASFCGQTLASLTAHIAANNRSGATSYGFEITYNNQAYFLTSIDRWFYLTEVSNLPLVYAASYSVRARVENGTGNWGAYGTACTVTTPAIATTELAASFCGQTLASLTAHIAANSRPGATSYGFEITYNNQAYFLTSTDRWFYLTEVSNLPLVYAASYSVRARVENGTGNWGAYGSACTITTPAIATTQLASSFCGQPLQSTTTHIAANSTVSASSYEFEVTHVIDGINDPVYTLVSTDRWFYLTEVIGMTVSNDQTYSIRVRIQSNGIWGAYGTPCLVSTPNPQGLAIQEPQLHTEVSEGIQTEEVTIANETTATLTETTPAATWTATATSNPFATSFQIKLNGAEGISSDASFTAQLTDMSGKVYSQATLNKEQLEAESFGEQLAPGMYLMTLRQGEELRVIRVVKR
jgi:hypothetical protein